MHQFHAQQVRTKMVIREHDVSGELRSQMDSMNRHEVFRGTLHVEYEFRALIRDCDK